MQLGSAHGTPVVAKGTLNDFSNGLYPFLIGLQSLPVLFAKDPIVKLEDLAPSDVFIFHDTPPGWRS
jgi:hypothetical protein